MKESMSNIERKVLGVIQEGFPISRTPYKDMAKQAGIETSELLAVLKGWKRDGKIRRIGAVVNHFKVGLGAGAMVVWQVESERIGEVGQIFAEFKEVSHAYERQVAQDWPYNLYTMVHGESTEDVKRIVKRMIKKCGVSDYQILMTEKELKKVPPRYITEPKSQG
ncbi:MAG: siroheme decarboxylase subunit beta [Planctomycetota bacterium]|jgi:DNA-binding Lrp family transcriptional regulator